MTKTEGTLVVAVHPRSEALQPIISLRQGCDASGLLASSTCAMSAGNSHSATMVLPGVTPGIHYVGVEGSADSHGEFDLEATLLGPETDACASAVPLELKAGQAIASGGTVAGGEHGASCSGTGGVVPYTLTLDDTYELTVSATPASEDSRPVISLEAACSAQERACTAAPAPGEAASLTTRLEPGRYWLWVHDAVGNAGRYTLSVRAQSTLPTDTCLDLQSLEFSHGPLGGSATASGDTSAMTDSTAGSCGGNGAPDAVYHFSTSDYFRFAGAVSTTSTQYQPLMYLRSGSCLAATEEQVCRAAPAPGGNATSVVPVLPPGEHFLWVDGADPVGGPFTVNASLTPPLQGDICEKAILLPDMRSSISGNTGPLEDDGAGSCGGAGAPDAVYTFTLSEPKDLNFFFRSEFPLSARLQTGGCPGSEVACVNAVPSQTTGSRYEASLRIPGLDAGSYSLWVDGQTPQALGTFSIDNNLSPAKPGASCRVPFPLVFHNGYVEDQKGSQYGLYNTQASSCGNATYNEFIYKFTTTEVRDLRVMVKPSWSTLYLRSGECTGQELACARNYGAGGLRYRRLPPGDHYLFVEPAINIQLAANLDTLDQGNTCANVKNLLFDTGERSFTAVDEGDTRDFTQDDPAGSSCGSPSRDVVYFFVVPQWHEPLGLRATVTTPSGTYQPHLYLRSSCDDRNSQLGCALAPAAGGTATLNVPVLTQGTAYFLWVSGAQGSAGPYSLQVTLGPTPSGESCQNVAGLPSSGITSGDTHAYIVDDIPGGSCGGAGPDVVYKTNLMRGAYLDATVEGNNGFQPVLYIRSVCDTSTTEEACAKAATAGQTASLRDLYLPAGNHYLWVRGAGAQPGTFTMTTQLRSPGDRCTEALPLTFSGNVAIARLDPGYYADDYRGSCSDLPQNDAVYQFTTTDPHAFRIEVSENVHRVFLRSADCLAGSEVACGAVGPGQPTFLVPVQPPGTYYLFLDYGGSLATDLKVTLE